MSTETLNKDILRGGQFLVKETSCEDIFTPEDFNEDQLMMKEAVTEFVDREIWSKKAQFEKKGLCTYRILHASGWRTWVFKCVSS